MSELLNLLNDELAATVEKVRHSLVEVHNGRRGAGAGIVWRSDGLVVTNAHVVSRRSIHVTLPDTRMLPARLLAVDTQHDLAVLSVEASGLEPIELGETRLVKPGQWVMALGHPWGVTGAVTAGIVIGEGSQLPEMPASGREWLVASLRLRPGHSGGPMFDIEGRLIGINTMITGPQVGVAVPVHIVEAFLRQANLAEAQQGQRGRKDEEYV